jgi:hypothetical protein
VAGVCARDDKVGSFIPAVMASAFEGRPCRTEWLRQDPCTQRPWLRSAENIKR